MSRRRELPNSDRHSPSRTWLPPDYTIPPNYDSLVGKLIVHGRNRNEALMRLRWALDEFIVDGIDTTIPAFQTLVLNSDIQNGLYDIHWLEKFLALSGRDAAGAYWPPHLTPLLRF